MVKDNKAGFSGLKFNGKPSDFQRWKDAVLAHLTQVTNRCRVTEIQAGRSAPTLSYQDLLTNPATVPALSDQAIEDRRKGYALETAFLQEQESYLRDLFNQTLPHGYMTQLSTTLVSQPIQQFWQQLETDFGQNNAMWMVGMIQEFEGTLAMGFGSIGEVYQRLRAVRNRLNMQGQDTLRVHLLPSQLMIGKMLSLIPSHLWGPSVTFTPDEFTLEKVEKKMRSIFGNKTKAEIQAMGKTDTPVPVNYADSATAGGKKVQSKKSGKRKATPLPMDDERVNACFYCNSVHNDMNGIGPHFKRDCPVRKRDIANGVGRKNNYSESKRLRIRKTDHDRVQKVQTAQSAPRVEIPVDAACLEMLSIAESGPSTPPVTASADVPLTPGGFGTLNSPVASSTADSDEDMDEFDDNGGIPVNNASVTSAAAEIEEKTKSLEDTDAGMD